MVHHTMGSYHVSNVCLAGVHTRYNKLYTVNITCALMHTLCTESLYSDNIIQHKELS